jgi:hypothetical protein
VFPLQNASEAVLDFNPHEWSSPFGLLFPKYNPGRFRNIILGTPAAQYCPEENIGKCALAPVTEGNSMFSGVLEGAAASVGLGGAGIGIIECSATGEYNGPALLGCGEYGLCDPMFNDVSNNRRSEGICSRKGPTSWSLDFIQAQPGLLLPGFHYLPNFYVPLNNDVSQTVQESYKTRAYVKMTAFGTAEGQEISFSSRKWSAIEKAELNRPIAFAGLGSNDTLMFEQAALSAPGSTNGSAIQAPNTFNAFRATVTGDPNEPVAVAQIDLGNGTMVPVYVSDIELPRARWLHDLAEEALYDIDNFRLNLVEDGELVIMASSTHYGLYNGGSGVTAFPGMPWINGKPVIRDFVEHGWIKFQMGRANGHMSPTMNAGDIYAFQYHNLHASQLAKR